MESVLTLIAVILTCICAVLLVIMIDIHKMVQIQKDRIPAEKKLPEQPPTASELFKAPELKQSELDSLTDKTTDDLPEELQEDKEARSKRIYGYIKFLIEQYPHLWKRSIDDKIINYILELKESSLEVSIAKSITEDFCLVNIYDHGKSYKDRVSAYLECLSDRQRRELFNLIADKYCKGLDPEDFFRYMIKKLRAENLSDRLFKEATELPKVVLVPESKVKDNIQSFPKNSAAPKAPKHPFPSTSEPPIDMRPKTSKAHATLNPPIPEPPKPPSMPGISAEENRTSGTKKDNA